jgi:hypothetical protein
MRPGSFRRILAMAGLASAGLVVAIQASGGPAGGDDPFALFDEIVRRSRAPSPDPARPKQVSELVFRRLVEAKNLSFRAILRELPSGKEVTADARMAQGRMCVVFTIQGRKAWKLLDDGKQVYGIRYEDTGGLRARKYRSLEDSEPDFPDAQRYACMSGSVLTNWLGASFHADLLRERIRDGKYLGTCEFEGEKCDIFFYEIKELGWFAYLVNSDGHKRGRLGLQKLKWWRPAIRRVNSYRDMSEAALPEQTWELSPQERKALQDG